MAKKRKVTVKVRRKAAVRRKSNGTASVDTAGLEKAPAKVVLPSNGPVFRVKVKRKK